MNNPFKQNFGHIQIVKSLLKGFDTNMVSVVSFTKRSTFKVDPELRQIQSNDLIVYDVELSEFITRKINVLKLQHKTPLYTEENIAQMYSVLLNHHITDPSLKEKHIESIKINQKPTTTDDAPSCKSCGKEVSEKVKQFCLSNKKRFDGSIYCYEHQKLY